MMCPSPSSTAMGIKVLGILGSPRREGNTELLLDRALAGAASAGGEIEKVVLSELRLSPCTNCDECHLTGECTIQDDMTLLYPKLRALDRLILASPIFFLSVSAQTKMMIDRCQSFWIAKYRLGRGIGGRDKRRGLFLSIAGRNRPREFQPAIAVVKAFFATIDVEYSQELFFGGIEGKGDVIQHPTVLEGALAAGARLVRDEGRGASVGEGAQQDAFSPVAVRPIGIVRNKVKEPTPFGWEEVESEILIREELAPALEGIEGFSHITVLFWMHLLPEEKRSLTKIHPRDREDLPLMGVLATRTQCRPNPVGSTTVRLLGRKGNRLMVLGLDAVDGSPVLDLKPYLPPYDSMPEVRMPDWVKRLQ